MSLSYLDQAEQLVLPKGFDKFRVELVSSGYFVNFDIRPIPRLNQEE